MGAESDLISRIEAALPAARRAAGDVGPLHGLWDTLQDYEALQAGRPTLLRGTRLQILQAIADALAPAPRTKQ